MIISYFALPFIILDSNTKKYIDIHFQYNIIMQALFLLSIELVRRKHFLLGAFAYSTLLNFKHIYLYSALAFFVYILKDYILIENGFFNKLKKLILIGIFTLIPFIVAFLPFVLAGGI